MNMTARDQQGTEEVAQPLDTPAARPEGPQRTTDRRQGLQLSGAHPTEIRIAASTRSAGEVFDQPCSGVESDEVPNIRQSVHRHTVRSSTRCRNTLILAQYAPPGHGTFLAT